VAHKVRKYVYELEVEEANIRHVGELNWYSAAVNAARCGEPFKDAVHKYCSGEEAACLSPSR
jgi:hypothetical protein